MARVLVIGGTLFIGRALVNQLLDRGDEVVLMHRGSGTPFSGRVAEIQCDRNDVVAVRAALAGSRFDLVFDNVYDWQRGTTADQVTGVAEAAAAGLHPNAHSPRVGDPGLHPNAHSPRVGDPGLRRYVFTSSIALYPPGGEYREDASLVPSDYPNAYGAQKAESERALFELQRRIGLPVSTVRPAFIYGPHNPFDREAFFWDRLLAGRPIVVPEDGLRTMQWVHVGDVARAAIAAATNDVASGQAYNLASYPPITQIDFVRLLAKIAGEPANVVPVPRHHIERLGGQLFAPPYYFGAYLDIPPISVRADRVRSDLGLTLMPLEDGLRETYDWYRRQRRPAPDFSWEDRLLASA